MTTIWAEEPSRILIAGDGTLLVVDQSPTEPRRLGEALAAGHPLRLAAEAMLSGDPVTAEGVLIRQLRTPRGQLAAVELRRDTATGLSLLPLRDWEYPAGGDLPAVELADGPAGRGLSLLLPDVPAFQSGIRELRRHGRMLRDLRLMDRDAEQIRTVRLYSWLPDPAPGAVPIGVSVDVTELTEVSEDAGRFLDALLSVGPDSVLVLDVPRGELLWSNRRLARQLKYPPETFDRYAEIRKAVWWSDRPRLDEAITLAATGLDSEPRELRLRLQDAAGRWRWMKLWLTPWLSAPAGSSTPADEVGGPVVEQLVCTLRDVDEAVQAEQQLHWEARHDPGTGLANRRGLHDMLQRVADELDNPCRYVYFLDLDDFRRVNDALGHSAGDELLRTLAARLSLLVQPADLVARFGGDEFVVVSAVDPTVLAERMLSAVHTRTMLAGSEVSVSCSIGVATVGSAELPGDIIRRSNDAMYQAKRAGRNTYRIAGPLNSGPARERVTLEADLRHAVAEASPQLYVAFQPVVDRDLQPVAAEALLRWAHPQRGTMLPAEFLDIADSAGLMGELGALIMRRSVTAAAAWAAAGHRLPVTVNVGARQLGSGQLERLLAELLEQTGMPGEMLCLEVTESVLVDGDSAELAELIRLRDLGIRIALDDFGTGYSPLTYLKRLPAAVVKLDRSFVTGLGLPEPDRADTAIARSVLQLGTDLGLRVIAEGVENERQLHALTELGYEFFQGFWAYSPMPADQLGALLARPRVAGNPIG